MNRKKLKFSNNGHLAQGNGRLTGLFDQIAQRRPVKTYAGPIAKTDGQQEYMDAIDDNTIVFATGPAGCGKTHLAVGKAVEGLKDDDYKRIVAIRPCLGVGKTMGFIPGEIEDKVAPYLRPVMDELKKFFTLEEIEKLQKMGILELGSLEHIRGRTLEDSFIILDEAQNCDPEQLSVFINRLGMGSKMVINGDITRYPSNHPRAGLYKQCDLHLPPHVECEFEYQSNNLEGIEGITTVHMTPIDMVRHPLLREIAKRS